MSYMEGSGGHASKSHYHHDYYPQSPYLRAYLEKWSKVFPLTCLVALFSSLLPEGVVFANAGALYPVD